MEFNAFSIAGDLVKSLFYPKCALCDKNSITNLNTCFEHEKEFKEQATFIAKKINGIDIFTMRAYRNSIIELIQKAKSGNDFSELLALKIFLMDLEHLHIRLKKIQTPDIIVNVAGSKPSLISSSMSTKLAWAAWKYFLGFNLDSDFISTSVPLTDLNWLLLKKQSSRKLKDRLITSRCRFKKLNFSNSEALQKHVDSQNCKSLKRRVLKILILDDVFTTGSSFHGFSDKLIKKLKEKGFHDGFQIQGYSFAFTPLKSSDMN